MVRFLSRSHIEQLVSIKDSVAIIEEFYRDYDDAKYVGPPRTVIHVDEKDAVWLNMPAYSLSVGGFVLKLINEYRQNPARHGLEAAGGIIMYYDVETGVLIGMLDAVSVTALRTGAIGGVGAKYLAPTDSRSAALIGSGRTAWTQLTALATVRNIEKLRVYSPTRSHRETFAEKASKILGIDAVAVDSAKTAIEKADVVLTATNAAEPVLNGGWLGENVHVTSIGALPTRRELDVETFRRANLIAADLKKAVLREAGDIMRAVEQGVVDPEKILELHYVVKNGVKRPSGKSMTILKSVGFAALDLYFSAAVLRKAEKEKVGFEFDF
ncbi:MAG: ornithine cyclodeaminase family protein [Candidatus Caldarchaeum sp.]